MGSYSNWLGQESTRSGLPNWIVQIIFGVLSMLASLVFSIQAFVLWIGGKPWNSTIQTAVRNGQPVMLPLGQQILVGGSLLLLGLILVVSALIFRPKDASQ